MLRDWSLCVRNGKKGNSGGKVNKYVRDKVKTDVREIGISSLYTSVMDG